VELDRASLAAESLSNEVASLDARGTIIWANAAWQLAARAESRDLLAGCTVGADFIRTFTAAGTQVAQLVAQGVSAVIAGEQRRFAQELISADGSRRWRLQANPLRGSSRGAVLIRSEVNVPARGAPWGQPDPEDLANRISRLTPREHEVLRGMVRGLNNREIAAELGIAYTTVRSHAQSVIEKLAARSRLQAVARVSGREVGGMVKKVPLGIGQQDVGVPAHIGLFYDAEPDLRLRQLEFLRPAIDDPRQGIVLFGPPGVARSMLGNLEADLGRSLDSEVRSGRLLIAQTDSDPDQLLENIRGALATLAARGTVAIRFIADVKWGAPGFPLPEDALWVESRVNEMLTDTEALVVCAYDVSKLPDRALVYGGLDTHPHVVIGDRLKENPSYLAPAEYMRALLVQLRSSAATSGGSGASPDAP
jgi:DNA-binding CsgD family transcriptional regulator